MAPRKYCLVVSCPKNVKFNVDHNDVMHKFPTDPALRKQWSDLLGTSHIKNLENVSVCSLHFEKERFHTSTCELLNKYNIDPNTRISCTKKCLIVPKHVLPSRNLPPKSTFSIVTAEKPASSSGIQTYTAAKASQPAPVRPIKPLETTRVLKKVDPTTKLLKIFSAQNKAPKAAESEPPKVPSPAADQTKGQPVRKFILVKRSELGNFTVPPNTKVKAAAPSMVQKLVAQPTALPVAQPAVLPIDGVNPLPPTHSAPLPRKVQKRMKRKTIVLRKPFVIEKAVTSQFVSTQEVELSGSLLDDMVEGMETDPEANLTLVWSEGKKRVDHSDAAENPGNLCRLCAKIGLMLIPIFDSKGSELAVKINECLPFQVQKSDSLPLKICLSCRRTVLRTHQFYMQCKEANSKLRGFVLKKNKASYNYITQSATSDSAVIDSSPSFKYSFGGDVDSNENISTYSFPKPAPAVRTIRRSRLADINPAHVQNLSVQKKAKVRGFECPHCDGSFLSAHKRCQHMWLQHAKLPCTICKAEFDNRKDYEHHQVYQHKLAPWLQHFLIHPTEHKECCFCDTHFSTLKELRTHTFNDTCPILNKLEIVNPRGYNAKGFTCDLCNKVYYKKGTLRKHMEMHVGIKDVPCDKCDKKFFCQSDMKRHRLVHSEERVAVCEKCGASFKHKTHLQTHYFLHMGRWNNKCTCCGETFRLSTDAELHFESHSFNDREAVNQVPFTKVYPFECLICGKPYRKLSYYEEHLKTHDVSSDRVTKPHVKVLCTICGKHVYNLNKHHSRMHEPRVSYECDMCQKVIKGKFLFTLHIRNHWSPLVKCEQCDLVFRQHRLKFHMSRVHVPKLFCCEFCGKAFKQKKNLDVHRRVHTNERPYKCNVCEFAFKQSGDRNKHQALHFKNK